MNFLDELNSTTKQVTTTPVKAKKTSKRIQSISIKIANKIKKHSQYVDTYYEIDSRAVWKFLMEEINKATYKLITRTDEDDIITTESVYDLINTAIFTGLRYNMQGLCIYFENDIEIQIRYTGDYKVKLRIWADENTLVHEYENHVYSDEEDDEDD